MRLKGNMKLAVLHRLGQTPGRIFIRLFWKAVPLEDKIVAYVPDH
jgi:hypothetical protein